VPAPMLLTVKVCMTAGPFCMALPKSVPSLLLGVISVSAGPKLGSALAYYTGSKSSRAAMSMPRWPSICQDVSSRTPRPIGYGDAETE